MKNWKLLILGSICGITAPMLFMLLVIVASLLRPGYSQIHNFISDLGIGPYAIIQNSNFVVFGLLSIGFALGLRDGLPVPQARSLKACVWLVVIFGFGILFAGVFPEDYLLGAPHTLASSTAFLSIIAAQLLIWRGLRSEDSAAWSRYREYSLTSGLLSIVMLVLLQVAISATGAYQGLAQRAFLLPWIWIEVTGFKLYSLFGRTEMKKA